jgi:hypothetical protein
VVNGQRPPSPAASFSSSATVCKDSNGKAAPSSSEETGSRLYGKPAPQTRDGWNGLPAQTSPLQEQETDRGMENLLLFILSSSVCTLVASVTLLLRPLLGLP